MSRPQKILVNFNQFGSSDLVTKAQTVINALTGNPDITTPQPSLATLQAAADDLDDAITAAAVGGKQQREIRDQKRTTLVGLMQQEANYVSLIANGNVAVMLGTGFDVSKTPSPIGPLPKPQTFVVSSPKKGMLSLSVESIKGAKNYQFEYKKTGDAVWTVVPSTKTRLVVEDLESAKEYVARVMPIGASTERTYSNEVLAVVI